MQQQQFEKNRAAFFADSCDVPARAPGGQTADEATRIFHGVEETKRGMSNFQPIPGYSGTNRRAEADNVFACTFAGSREQGQASLGRISDEKTTTLHGSAKFMPYANARRARE